MNFKEIEVGLRSSSVAGIIFEILLQFAVFSHAVFSTVLDLWQVFNRTPTLLPKNLIPQTFSFSEIWSSTDMPALVEQKGDLYGTGPQASEFNL